MATPTKKIEKRESAKLVQINPNLIKILGLDVPFEESNPKSIFDNPYFRAAQELQRLEEKAKLKNGEEPVKKSINFDKLTYADIQELLKPSRKDLEEESNEH
jgi:hypothetical protein